MHMIAVIPAARVAFTLALTSESSSSWYCAAFGVADHDVGAAELRQHAGGDLTGIGAGLVRGHVLGAVQNAQSITVDQRLHAPQIGIRRQDRHVDGVQVDVGE